MSTETPTTANPLAELVNALTAAFQATSAPSSASGSPMAMPAAFADHLSTSDQLFRLLQGNSTIHQYSLHFRTLAAASGWNETALLSAYRQGLNPQIRSAMALYDDSIGLETFLQRTARVSQRLAACQPTITTPQPASVVACTPVPEPMQVDSSRLSRSERNRRMMNGLCLYCGNSGHLLRTCPIRPPRSVSPEPAYTPEIPAEYMPFQDVFSKQAATHPTTTSSAMGLRHRSAAGGPAPQGASLPSVHPRAPGDGGIHQGGFTTRIHPTLNLTGCFFVGKKDGGLRPCIDYRQLNSQIIQQPYPLPLVPATFEELRGAQVFTKLDLGSAYNLVCVREGDEWKTAFVTPTGHYEYRVMPYGLSISPSVFQTFMNEVFREFLHRFVIVYFDDILIYSRNLAEHRQHIQQVLQKLRQQREFHLPSVQFLGYVISAEGVQMDQGKVTAIQNWPQPTTIKELQRFLGFSNFYHRFIQNYSSITAPLTSLLKGKPRTITWNPATHEAFQQLKKIFSTAPLLRHPDPQRPFTVEVDASTTGVGAVLSQAVGESSLLHPCAYYSRKLSPAEQNYDVGNRELLAIKLALEEWRHWLEGWALFFTRFNFTITYRPGQYSPDLPTEPETILPSDLIVSPIQWELDLDIQNATLQEPAPPDCPEGKIYVPQHLRLSLLGTAHKSLGSGHPGSQRTLSLLHMRRDTISYPQANWPWSHLGVDFVTDLPVAEGNTCILIAVDRFSKMCKFVKGLPTAMETAELLFQHLFRHFGLPEEIVSDRGPQFISHVWKAFFKLLGVSVNLSSGYHPQTNAQTERRIQELGRYLRSYCHEDQHSWDRFLLWAEYAQNSLRQDTTGMTPFQCVPGYQPPLFPWTEEPSNVPAVDYWFRESERVWDSAHHQLLGCVSV
ncbi:hypothetical protein M9458_019197 [Cirrhinus mrigala]|uniref:ribonuclease H n=1 Tax=Cirrhinus mrigala TaxID=683832 RepID=A0ABD0QC70_CIRMR